MSKNKKILFLFVIFIVTLVTFNQINKNQNENLDIELSEESYERTYYSEIDIKYLRSLSIDSEKPTIEEELEDGINYKRYIVSYISQNNKIYGLLTIPKTEAPNGGFSAIVFNHGYVPPDQYVTTEKYVSYVDNLARNGFVVLKIDMRGHGKSEGNARGSYFNPGYTIDAISALKSLQKLEYINDNKIGMWGHSMAGNLVLRAMLVEPEIRAGVIWSGAVYSYEDFGKYGLNDNTYVRRESSNEQIQDNNITKLRTNPESIDFSNEFWSAVSLTNNIDYLNSPIQLHHAVDDNVVNIGYTRDLINVLKNSNASYEFYEYPGGGHNIESPYFEQAMENTIKFYKEKL